GGQERGAGAVAGDGQDREGRAQAAERLFQHALDRGGVDRDARGAEAAVQQDLGDEAAQGVADDDGGPGLLPDDLLVEVGYFGDAQAVHDFRVLAQRFDLDLHAGPGRGGHLVAAPGVALDPVLPGARGQPQPMNEDDAGPGLGVIGHGY